MNHFECAFAHLVYIKNVDYKKCHYNFVNAKRVDYVVTFVDGTEMVGHNVSWRSHAKKLMDLYLSSEKKTSNEM